MRLHNTSKILPAAKRFSSTALVEESRDFVFGSNTQADVITGHNKNDYLYGGAGNNTLSGCQDNDWLECGDGLGFLKSCQATNNAEWRMVA